MRVNWNEILLIRWRAGQWKNPLDKSSTKDRAQYYISLAKLAEKGKITSIFFTDGYGEHEVFEQSAAADFMGGGHVGKLDPVVFVAPMALATKSVGIVVTGSSSYLSILDHITDGRIGWNVVTSFSDSGAKAMGLDEVIPHDERYERADEFMNILYDLWEGSWEDGAQVFDAQRDMAYDPKKIHKVAHKGKYYKLQAYHQTHPSPQRTPVIFQAGASKAGMAFAGKHAEALFVAGPTPEVVKKQVQTVRAEADRQGRDGSKIKFFVGILPVLGRTMEEARSKYETAMSNVHAVGGMARFSGFTNLDLSLYPPDEPFVFKGEQSEASIHGTIKNIKAVMGEEDDRPWTPRRLGERMSFGGTGCTPVGTPEMVADVMEIWMREAGIDGFNILHVVELLVPELQRRGVYWEDYPVPGGTLRENMVTGFEKLKKENKE
ncbi:luciferase-like domain-containing protein [Halenospora varia]|nr:luciferase-like domain-containing protein [Halenospora varia]